MEKKVAHNSKRYPTKVNNVRLKAYEIWRHMVKRCGHLDQVSENNYQDVYVCDRWLDYSNFYEDVTSMLSYREIKFCLDKDLLVVNNKVYSKDTCCFLPYEINNFLTDSRATRGEFVVGVDFHSKTKKFRARCQKHLGLFDTEQEAFLVYKNAKEYHARTLANVWKEKIDDKAHQALLNYTVNIED